MAAAVPELGAPGEACPPLEIVTLLRKAERQIPAETLEAVVDDDVDDPGNGVGPIGRGGAAGHHVHPADEDGRDQVQIDLASGRGRNVPTSVDQNEGPNVAERAQVGERGAR